jgi:hypothetical protein
MSQNFVVVKIDDEETHNSITAEEYHNDYYDDKVVTLDLQTEGEEYNLPEDQLGLDVERRLLRFHKIESSSAARPAYLETCYDEFSRDFCSFSVAAKSKSEVPLVDYDGLSSLDFTLRFPEEVDGEMMMSPFQLYKGKFLQHYHPCYTGWNSTFRRMPMQKKDLLQAGPRSLSTGDCHLLVEVSSLISASGKHGFEPIFGSLALYTFVNEECVRLSESFHFDRTSEIVRGKFKEVYWASLDDPDYNNDPSRKPSLYIPPSMALFTIPEELKRKEIFLVVQLTKVLTGDPDKAVAPYYRSSFVPDALKLEETCRRLHSYRQPLGIAVIKMFDEQPRARERRGATVRFSFFAQKNACNEPFIGGVR